MSAVAERAVPKQFEPYAWKPGQSGNPAGRSKGNRNKLGEAFIGALHDDFVEHGVGVIKQVREDKPKDYLKIVAAVIPQEVHLTVESFDGTDDYELATEFFRVARALQERFGVSLGIGAAGGSSASEDRPLLAANGDAGTERRNPPVGEGEVRRGSSQS